jgi:hypothetical protein
VEARFSVERMVDGYLAVYEASAAEPVARGARPVRRWGRASSASRTSLTEYTAKPVRWSATPYGHDQVVVVDHAATGVHDVRHVAVPLLLRRLEQRLG